MQVSVDFKRLTTTGDTEAARRVVKLQNLAQKAPYNSLFVCVFAPIDLERAGAPSLFPP